MSDPKKNITYLLGAGASQKTIPIVEFFADKLKTRLEAPENERDNYLFGLQITGGLNFLNDLIQGKKSPDTVARKLYLKESEQIRLGSNTRSDYRRLKAAIEAFVTLEQFWNEIDPRYDLFWGSVLQKNRQSEIEIPSNLNFLSWNYDTLLEKSLSGFLEEPNQAFNLLQSIPIPGHQANAYDVFRKERSALVKLNGSIGCTLDKTNTNVFPGRPSRDISSTLIVEGDMEKHSKNSREHINQLLGEIEQGDRKQRQTLNMIHYAWEQGNDYIWNKQYFDLLPERIDSICQKTDVLIVIGYSFPYFNRLRDA